MLTFADQKVNAAELPSKTHELEHGNARVVLVGDSITGLSRNASAGFAHQMDWALKQVYQDCKPNIIALGGSGQGVTSWSGTEKRSRAEELFLDVKGIPVKSTLDQHADVLVIMLGMNDVLAPYVLDEPESLQKWTDTYRALVQSLQVRLTPKVTALATPTLCTEDVHSPKNRMMDKLCERVAALADELHLIVLPTNITMREVLAEGRRLKPDFHVTYDYVHPNDAGQLAIAMGMLKGLGCEKAARKLREERLAKVFQKAAVPSRAALIMIPLEMPLRFPQQNGFGWGEIRDWREIQLLDFFEGLESDLCRLPLGWPFIQRNFTGIPAEMEFPPAKGFQPAGDLFAFELLNKNSSRGSGHHMSFPTLWRVSAGLMRPNAWKENKIFEPALAHGPVEEAIEQGRILDTPVDLGGGKKLGWQFYRSTVDYTGGDSPGSVDFAAVTHARNFEGGVAARSFFSKHERRVHLDLSTQTFAGILHLTVYLNGRVVYSGLISNEPRKRKTVDAMLQRGRNILAFTLDHVAWQMQANVDIRPLEDDSLDDLLCTMGDCFRRIELD